jgi:predicted HTH transcriptional regulator
MSEAEKQDFRSTRQELSFELEVAPYKFPADFDDHIVQDFCNAYRNGEGRKDWTNEEVLIDSHLVKEIDGKLCPLNSLVLLAAKDPRVTVPGCRVRGFAGRIGEVINSFYPKVNIPSTSDISEHKVSDCCIARIFPS